MNNKSGRSIWNSIIWLVPLILSCIGIIMIISITSQWSIDNTGAPFSRGIKQIQSIFIGFFMMLVFLVIPLKYIEKYSGFFWLFAILLTILTLFPGIGVKVGGARRWIDIYFFRFQPIEFLILAVIVELTKVLSKTSKNNFQSFIDITLFILVVSSIPLILQPNMSGVVLVFLICMLIHIEIKGWAAPIAFSMIILPIFVILISQEAYRLRRYLAFIDPWKDPLSIGFQIIQGLVAFSNGGIFGVGIGNGLQKMNFLPAAHTDYILATIGEEFGLIGTLLVVFLFFIWTFRIYFLYKKTFSVFSNSLMWGICISILLSFFINIGGVTRIIPLTGVPLPFMSYGGSAMVFAWIKVGLLMRINKEAARLEDDT